MPPSPRDDLDRHACFTEAVQRVQQQEAQVTLGFRDEPEAIQVLLAADRLIAAPASMPQAIIWFQTQKIPGLGHKTAAELVATGRTQEVLDHLAMLEDGVYA